MQAHAVKVCCINVKTVVLLFHKEVHEQRTEINVCDVIDLADPVYPVYMDKILLVSERVNFVDVDVTN